MSYSAPNKLHFLSDTLELELRAFQIYIGGAPRNLAEVLDNHRHPQLTTPDESKTSIFVPTHSVLLEKDVKTAIESRPHAFGVVALDSRGDMIYLVFFGPLGDCCGQGRAQTVYFVGEFVESPSWIRRRVRTRLSVGIRTYPL
jgi:hypothetical protein